MKNLLLFIIPHLELLKVLKVKLIEVLVAFHLTRLLIVAHVYVTQIPNRVPLHLLCLLIDLLLYLLLILFFFVLFTWRLGRRLVYVLDPFKGIALVDIWLLIGLVRIWLAFSLFKVLRCRFYHVVVVVALDDWNKLLLFCLHTGVNALVKVATLIWRLFWLWRGVECKIIA
jgi:hypothetical protein